MTKWLDHSSILGKIGGYGDKYLNPISWITGGKSTKLTSTVLPEKVNSGLSTVMKPFEKVDKTINPVRRIPIVNRAGDIIASKPGDALALVAGAIAGSAALGGGSAAGGAGGAGGGGLAAGGEGTAMGGSAGTLGAADSSAASTGLGLTAGDVGASAGGGDVAGLAAADSAAVDAEGAEPGLTQGYGPAQEAPTVGQQQFRPQQQQRRRQQPMVQPVTVPGAEGYAGLVSQLDQQIAQSSKSVKTRGATQAAMQRGLDCAHPVDTNGVHIAAIQELKKQIDSLGKQIAAAKARRAAKGTA
jgi:hypothetical protein